MKSVISWGFSNPVNSDRLPKIHAFAWIFHFNAVSIVFVSTFQQCRNHCLKEGLLLELRSFWCKNQRTNLMLPEPPLSPALHLKAALFQPPKNCVSHCRAISHSLLRITCLSCRVDCDCGWSRRLISITSNGRGCAMGSSFSCSA